MEGPESDLNELISSITGVFERQQNPVSSSLVSSSSVPVISGRPQIIQNLYRPSTSVISPTHIGSPILPSTTPNNKFQPEPRSAPPESPIRERQVHDRRLLFYFTIFVLLIKYVI